MPKTKQTPGIALSALLEKHDLNYNRLAKAIGLSSAMIRLIARDESPVSASVAYRLAKFFKTKPEYWLELQLEYDCSQAAEDKKLTKALASITTVDKATFERKPRTTKAAALKGAAAKGKKGAAAKKAPASKKAASKTTKKAAAPKKVAVKKVAAKSASLSKAKSPDGKRGRPAAKSAAPKATQSQQKKTADKTVINKAPVAKRAAVKPSTAVKKEPSVSTTEVRPMPPPPQSTPIFYPDPVINEPDI